MKCPIAIDLMGIEEFVNLNELVVYADKYSGCKSLLECKTLQKINIRVSDVEDFKIIVSNSSVEELIILFGKCVFTNDFPSEISERLFYDFESGYYCYRNFDERTDGDYVEALHIDNSWDLS